MPRPALANEAAQLIDRLDRLMRSREAEHGLNPAQWEALRFLGRANRFSRTPASLADYLGVTRGTVSQSLISLEAKGYVARSQGARDKRSVDLDLTPRGRSALQSDPLHDLAGDVAAAPSEDLERVVALLRDTLARAITRNGGKQFGMCQTCRHFKKTPSGMANHAYCTLLNEPLSREDAREICVEQELASAH